MTNKGSHHTWQFTQDCWTETNLFTDFVTWTLYIYGLLHNHHDRNWKRLTIFQCSEIPPHNIINCAAFWHLISPQTYRPLTQNGHSGSYFIVWEVPGTTCLHQRSLRFLFIYFFFFFFFTLGCFRSEHQLSQELQTLLDIRPLVTQVWNLLMNRCR